MNPLSIPSDQDRHVAAAAQGTMSDGKIRNYLSERGAQAYLQDHRKKLHRRLSDRRERRILRGFFAITGESSSLLDAPSGFGRLLPLFREHAAEVVAADLSGTMLALNEQLHGRDIERLQCSALAVPRPDRSYGAVVSVRLNHHLDRHSDRLQHIAELCRLAEANVVFTYFSATSVKNRLRRLRSLWSGKRPKNCLTSADVRNCLEENGFELVAARPLARLSSGHVYVLARRMDRDADTGGRA